MVSCRSVRHLFNAILSCGGVLFSIDFRNIFDGHSGTDVAAYLRNHLFDSILGEPDFWEDTMGAIRRAYHRTDREVLRKKKAIVDGKERPRRGGSTAVTVILLNGETLVVANVGDSHAVVCEDGRARQLSVDHERDAIESRGGFVTQMHGTENSTCRATYHGVHGPRWSSCCCVLCGYIGRSGDVPSLFCENFGLS